MMRVQEDEGGLKAGQLFRPESGKVVSFEALVDRLASREIVFIGEIHDEPEHHLIQVQIIQALLSEWKQADLAMEFFQEPQQPHLDRYLQGKMSETAFLEAVDWEKSWGYDYHLYRPLMLAAKASGCRVLAINAPRAVVRKVARTGLAGLDEGARRQVAREIDLENEAHRRHIRGVFERHPRGEVKAFRFFYEAQCVWEETMAENLAESYRRNRTRLIVLCGNGHIVNRFGIPDRVKRRLPVPMATVMPYPAGHGADLGKGAADFVWLTGGAPVMPMGHGHQPRAVP